MCRSRSRSGTLALWLGVLSASWSAGQGAPQPAPPVFRSNVDLVVVEATVVDRSGAVAAGLAAADFQVEIGGRAREVVSAELVEYGKREATEEARALPDISTNADQASRRTVLFVADQSSLGPENRAILESARRWLRTLAPTDRVGFVAIPPPGPNVEFTTEHARVEEAFGKIMPMGSTARPAFLQRNVSLWEGLQIADGDFTTRGDVVARECPTKDPVCESDVDSSAREIAMTAQSRAQPTLAAFQGLLQGLRVLPGQKHVVLLSAGWPIAQSSMTGQVEPVAAAAAAANATIHALVAEQFGLDASTSRPSPRMSLDRELVTQAVETLSGMTGGQSARVIGTGEAALERLHGVMSGYYRLGVRPTPADLDGRRHRISVKVSRPGLSLRSYRRVMMASPGDRTPAPTDAAAALKHAVTAAAPLTGLALRATSYVLHDDEPGERVRVWMAGDVEGGAAGGGKLSAVLFDQRGRAVSGGEQELVLPAGGREPVQMVFRVPPGTYLMRVAAVDAKGTVGSVQRTVEARWQKISQVETTGLALFRAAGPAGQAAQPVLDVIRTDEQLIAQIPFSMATSARPLRPTVTLEVSRPGSAGPPLLRSDVRIGRTRGDRMVAQENVAVGLLPPGRYRVSVTVQPGFPPLSRTILVAGPAAAATETAATAASPAMPAVPSAAVLARPARFQTASVLDPSVVAPVLDQLAARPDAASVRGELTALHAGPWSDEAAKGALASAPVAAHFVAGLGLLQKGDLEGAANQFRQALRLAPDFLPAMAYLGACYAAGGKDKEAASAWQTALVRSRDTPWLQRLAIESWLRAERLGPAQALIKQARERFPNDESFAALQARAFMADGKVREGLDLVATLKSPDADVLLMALSALYTASESGAPVWDAARDREAFTRWRDAYAAANGASLPLVDMWAQSMKPAAP